jgi:SGNH hydrolase-like domain, acetyltransferase AlgX
MGRYLVYLVSSAALVGLLFASFAFYFGPVQGDLTRIGGWPERDFAPTAMQPPIAPAPRTDTAASADVLVLGDSFSQPNEWQSVLFAQTRLTAHTTHFDAIGCLDNWVRWALAQPAQQAIVVQTVEREFVKRFRDSVSCKPSRAAAFDRPAASHAANPAVPALAIDAGYLARTGFNTGLARLAPANTVRKGSVVNAPIDSACANFSNRQSNRLLYYQFDEERLKWSRNDVDRSIGNVRALQERFQRAGRKFVFVLIPDKLSVYQDCLKQGVTAGDPGATANLTSRLRAAEVNAPDLHPVFAAARASTADFYYPNNTHLSENGYRLLATQVAGTITK